MKFNIEQLKCGNMVMTGSSILEAIQNKKNAELDLLIREAIQNSLDAKPKDNEKPLIEKINIGDICNAEKFANYFSKIETELTQIAKNKKYTKYICLKDINTTGLTGEVMMSKSGENNLGNYLSLIKNIAKPQKKFESGGSWGYGKTIYYNMGIGLVLYYSRMYEKNSYKSKLIACLIEDEKKTNGVLSKFEWPYKSGVAWWGGQIENGEVLPIEDEKTIEQILSHFRLEPYKNDETGTCIIIPFLDDDLLEHTTQYELEDSRRANWCGELVDYIDVACQRWYPTKIDNKYINDDKIELYINEEKITLERFKPVFKIIQEMYNYNELRKNDSSKINIIKEEVNINGVVKNRKIGDFYFAELDKEQLNMTVPNNEPEPLMQITNEKNNLDKKVIIAYCRKPGMIIDYDYNGEWTNGLMFSDEGKYIIGLFVPLSNEKIIVGEKEISVEEYLRECEGADHFKWNDCREFKLDDNIKIDTSNLKIVEKIQRNIKNKIKATLLEKQESNGMKIGSELSRQLASLFLPKTGYGRKAEKVETSNTSSVSKPKRKTKLNLLEGFSFENGYREKRFNIVFSKNSFHIKCELEIETDNGKIKADKWEEEMENNFPISIHSILIDSITINEKVTKAEKEHKDSEHLSYYDIKKLSSKNNTWYGFEFVANEEISLVEGKIKYIVDDARYQFTLDGVEVSNNEK